MVERAREEKEEGRAGTERLVRQVFEASKVRAGLRGSTARMEKGAPQERQGLKVVAVPWVRKEARVIAARRDPRAQRDGLEEGVRVVRKERMALTGTAAQLAETVVVVLRVTKAWQVLMDPRVLPV